MQKAFLSAEWRKLIIANYAVDSQLLTPYLPYGTELDFWEGKCYVSLVGFMFLNTRVMGWRIPFHTDFEEVNLRFYVKQRDENGAYKRGVVFIKEIVPRPAIALVANTLYKEHYATAPMAHQWKISKEELRVTYQWKTNGWQSMEVVTDPKAQPMAPGSEEEFITEHYWGYTKRNQRQTGTYEVEHPRWEVYPVRHYNIHLNFAEEYGADFGFLTRTVPHSVLLAEGSEIRVNHGALLKQ